MKYSRAVGSRFEALGVLGSKSCRKQTLIFFGKKWGSVFFNFLIRALLRPQIAIRIFATFSHIIFSLFWPLKIKISWKKLYGHNTNITTSKFCTKIFQKNRKIFRKNRKIFQKNRKMLLKNRKWLQKTGKWLQKSGKWLQKIKNGSRKVENGSRKVENGSRKFKMAP